VNTEPPWTAAAPEGAGEDRPLEPLPFLPSAIFKDVTVDLRVGLGDVRLTVDELLKLILGSVVTLEAMLSDLVELRLNDVVVARGEIVAVGDNFGVRIVDVAAGP
jgi:flagellar motor switch protein FliN/FliY